MEPNKILTADILDVLFDDRNKSYGAYELRKRYSSRIGKAMLITCTIVISAFLAAYFARMFNGVRAERIRMLPEINIATVKIEDKTKPIIIKPKTDIVQVKTRVLTPPLIKKDEDVEKPLPTQDDLKDAKIGLVDKDGPDDKGISTPAEIDGNKGVIEAKKQDNNPTDFGPVEVEASFPGGESKWHQYLERNCDGQVAAENGASEGVYTVIIQFVVDREGKISDVKALTKLGYGMEEEAVRVIIKGPNWKPANQNGRAVKAYRKQPISFLVKGE